MRIKMLTLLVLFGMGCSHYNEDNTLLQIGLYKLTVADYEFIRSNTNYKDFTHAQLEDVLIEEGQIIAFALAHKYDSIEILNKQLEYALSHYASRVDGYVWNKKVKPLIKVTEDDIQRAYHMRDNDYYLNLIYFPEEGLLKQYYKSEYPLKSEKDFYSVKEKISSNPNIRSYNDFMRYPFYPLGIYCNEIVKSKVGDVLGPFETLNGYYMVHVGAIQNATTYLYEQEKTIISQELLNSLKEKYILESQQQIFLDTNPKMYEDAIIELASKVNIEDKE